MILRSSLLSLCLLWAFSLGLGVSPAAAQPAAPLSGDPMAPSPLPMERAAPVPAPPTFTVAPVGGAYLLGTGDKIRVIVYGEDALSGQFVVSGNGKVSMPLIGEVNANGLTVAAFQSTVEQALRQGYLKEPRVSAEVLTYRPYYILGEVNKPGEYPYSNGLTAMNAIATAGGFTYRAQQKKIFIRRAEGGEEVSLPLTSATPVSPGDTLRIAERIF